MKNKRLIGIVAGLAVLVVAKLDLFINEQASN